MTPDGIPPEELLARFRERGEVEALGALFDATSPTLFRMALALAPDPASAEDAVQETFLTLMASGSHYDPSRPLLPWMVGILQLKVHEARRRARRTVDPARLAPPVFPDDPSRAAETGEEVERIRAALDALPEPYRAVAILRWRYGLEPAAIADARNEPPGTVRSLLHRAQEKLRGSLRLMPAFLLVERVPRGMDAVRSTVMAKGALVAAAAGVSVAGVVAAGGLLMAPKALAAGIAVLLLGGTAWFTFAANPPRSVPPASPPVARAKPLPRLIERAPDPVVTPLPPPGPVPGDLPPTLDLSKCDCDLDLFGTTVDEFGRPVPGARIETVVHPWRRTGVASLEQYYVEEVGLSTRSAIDGTFCFRLSRGEMVSLRATAAGYGDGYLEIGVAGERVAVALRLGGATVNLTVLDEDRKAVPGASVRLQLDSPGMRLFSNPILNREQTSDQRGLCTFSHLPAGNGYLSVRHTFLGTPDSTWQEIPAAGTLALEIVLYRGRTVIGCVTDASTGRPVAGACVGAGSTQERPVTTDSDGRYALPGVARGLARGGVQVSAAEYGTQLRAIPLAGEIDFQLEPAFSAIGRVVSPEGTPVQGARILVYGYCKGPDSKACDTSTDIADSGGRFRVANLSRKCALHDLAIEARGHGLVAWAFRPPPGGDRDLDLGDVVLPASRAVEGRALDSEGDPIPGADVWMSREKGPGDPGSTGSGSWAVPLSTCYRRTDDLGRFRFPDLSPGRWHFILSTPSAPSVEAQVDLTTEEDITDLVLAQKGQDLSFLVTDEGGHPIPGIPITSDFVFPSLMYSRPLMAATDPGGRTKFRGIPELPKGNLVGYRFKVNLAGDPSSPWTGEWLGPVVPAGQEIQVVLRPLSTIRGRLLGPSEEPMEDVMVKALDASGNALPGAVCVTNGFGEFTLGVESGATVTLRIVGAIAVHGGGFNSPTIGSTPWRGERPGVRSPSEGVVLRATKPSVDGGLDIVVLDLDGTPVSNYPLVAMCAGDGRSGRTDGTGRVRWEGMASASWHLVPGSGVPTGAPEDGVPPAGVDFVPKGQELILRFRRGIAQEGTVYLPDGTPASGAILGVQVVRGGGGPARQPKTDDRGRFKVWFGEGDEFRIAAVWKDGRGVVLRGESPELNAGGPAVNILLAPE